MKLTPREGKGEKERERGGNGEKKVRKKGEDKKVFGTGLQKQKILPTYIHYKIKIVP